MTENNGTPVGTSDDGIVVLSIPVPVMTKATSAPELTVMGNGTASGAKNNAKQGNGSAGTPTTGKEEITKENMTKIEMLKSYRLHIFVFVIFFITVLSVSLSWHFRNMALEQLYESQTIFFNPRTRELTLADPTSKASVRGHLGLDIPLWMLPLHCPIVSNGDPHFKECLWKNHAILRIVHFQGQNVQCYNISWVSLDAKYAPHDCYYIDKDKWYGPSNQSQKSFPISGDFRFQPRKNYTLSNNGVFNSAVDFYWLSSSGAAIYINANSPIQVTWNATNDGQLCLRSNFSGPLYHKSNSYDYPDMNYTLCNGMDSLKTHMFMLALLAPNHDLRYPSNQILTSTHWSLKSYAQTENITQDHVIDLLTNATERGFSNNQITLDGKWQYAHGDLDFDEERFPNWTEMIETVHSKNSHLTICVSPYFQYSSKNFHKGITTSVFVNDAGGEVTGFTSFQGGLVAILDVFADGGNKWYRDKLKRMIDVYGMTDYRLTYGDQAWLPYKPHFNDVDATPNMYRKLMTESFVSLPVSSLVVEHTSETRHVTSLIPVFSEIRLVNNKMCITEVIETALTLGLMGYPFVMADGVRFKSQTDLNHPQVSQLPSKELFIRWLQLSTLFPAFQFSVVPWEYEADVVYIATNLTLQREQTVLAEMKKEELIEEVSKGLPILRPVWWLDPQNRSVHDMQIADEFLIGNNLLVAPVLCEDVQWRDIYVPPGVWEDVDMGTFVLGPNTLRNYSVSQHSIPMFRRRKIVGEKLQLEL